MTDPWLPPASATVQTGVLAPFAQVAPAPRFRADLLAGLAVAAGTLLLAAPVGLLWTAVSPRVAIVVRGAESFVFDPSEPEQYVGADASFALLTLVVGLALGVLCWRALRRWGPGVAVGLAVAGLAASFTAMTVGERHEEPRRAKLLEAVTEGTPGRVEASVRLRSREATVAWPLGALAGFLLPLAYRRDEPTS